MVQATLDADYQPTSYSFYQSQNTFGCHQSGPSYDNLLCLAAGFLDEEPDAFQPVPLPQQAPPPLSPPPRPAKKPCRSEPEEEEGELVQESSVTGPLALQPPAASLEDQVAPRPEPHQQQQRQRQLAADPLASYCSTGYYAVAVHYRAEPAAQDCASVMPALY